MIDLNKKYKTKSGLEVVLLDIVDNKVFGRVYTNRLPNGEVTKDKKWRSAEWFVENGTYFSKESHLDLVEVNNFKIKDLRCKYITYFGYKLYVPKWAGWIATDQNGEVWVFEYKPQLTIGNFIAVSKNRTFSILEPIEYEGDWEDSLMEIK